MSACSLSTRACSSSSPAAVKRARRSRSTKWLGAVVLAGLLSALISLGWLFHTLSTSSADVLPVVLPAMYALVLVLGFAMLADRNPFAQIATSQLPVLSRPVAGAYADCVLLAPLTLPCVGPLIVAAFALGSVGGSGETIDALAYFLAFGLGFGWPLVAIPFLAASAQRRALHFLTCNHRAVTIVSGILLVAVAALGL